MDKFLEGNLAGLNIHTFWHVNSISISLPMEIFRETHKDLYVYCLYITVKNWSKSKYQQEQDV